jgi:hypothetical protein
MQVVAENVKLLPEKIYVVLKQLEDIAESVKDSTVNTKWLAEQLSVVAERK